MYDTHKLILYNSKYMYHSPYTNKYLIGIIIT